MIQTFQSLFWSLALWWRRWETKGVCCAVIYAMLCCAMMRCVVLRSVALRYVVLGYLALCYVMSCYVMLLCYYLYLFYLFLYCAGSVSSQTSRLVSRHTWLLENPHISPCLHTSVKKERKKKVKKEEMSHFYLLFFFFFFFFLPPVCRQAYSSKAR